MMKRNKWKWLGKTMRLLESPVLVVEGRHDEEALREMGVKTEIVKANGKTERIIGRAKKEAEKQNKKIALLFDFDREGERKVKNFREAFFAEDVNVDLRPRREAGRLFRVRTIEELPASYYRILDELEEGKKSG